MTDIRKRVWPWLAILALAQTDAPAQVVYKCAAKGRPASFQGEPCAAGESLVSVREFAVAAPVDPLPSAPPAGTRTRSATRTSAGRRATARASSGVSIETCADTRARRDEWERNAGLRRTFDDLRRWNDAVSRSCR